MEPSELPRADQLHLSAAQGWAELGNYSEANAELANIIVSLRTHPDALEVRWHIHAHVKNWRACLGIAEAMIKQAPQRPAAWLLRSVALHELNRTQKAFD